MRLLAIAAIAAIVGGTDPLHAAIVKGSKEGEIILTPFCRPPTNPAPPPETPRPQPDARCLSCPESCQGSPCNLITRSYVTSETDLVVSTPGFPIVVARNYDSSRWRSSDLGWGWRTNLIARVNRVIYDNTNPLAPKFAADVQLHDGGVYRFLENADGTTYTPPLGRFDTLIRNGDGSFTFTPQLTRNRLTFASSGRLSTMADSFGNTLSYTYDGNGRLQRVADLAGSGRYVDVTWSPNGAIHLVRDHTGRQVEYVHTYGWLFGSLLEGAIDPLGRKTEYFYGFWGLEEVRDHWNRVVTELTWNGQAVDTYAGSLRSFVEDGETWTTTFPVTGGQVFKTDSAGHRWGFQIFTGQVTTITNPDNSFSLSTYDANGRLVDTQDEAGVKSHMTYDSFGRLASVTRDYQGPTAIRFDYAYDPAFPDRTASVTAKNATTLAVDRDWQSWRYDYHPTGSTAPGALHHVYRIRDDSTEETVATYLYNSRGQVTRFTNARGNATDYGYDTAGNLTTVTGPANNDAGTRPLTTYVPDALGRTLSVTDPLTHVTSFTYDALGRILTVTLPKPVSGSPLNFVTTYRYDQNPQGDVLETHIVDPNGRTSRLGYDQFGRLARSIDPLGNETTYQYSQGLLVSITDANGNVTRYTYDMNRRLAETQFPDGAVESYLYHPDGLLREKTDRKIQTTRYTYDRHKRLDTEQLPTGTIDYTYDGQKMIQVFDASISPAETHGFTFDRSYRVESNTQGPRGTISYTYHPDDTVAGYAVAGGASTSYSYYPDGSLDSITWSLVAGQFKYRYDLAGRYQSITFPNNQTRNFTHDDQGRLTQISSTHPTAGNLATYGYSYDRDHATGTDTMLGQRTGMTATVPSQGLAAAPTKYYYDPAYRLTRADYPSAPPFNGEVHSWTYDGIGNRLTNTVNSATQTYLYQAVSGNTNNWQRLQSDGTASFTYDANGNRTQRQTSTGTMTYTWDAEDRLTTISGSTSASYKYDYLGRRSEYADSLPNRTGLFNGLDVVFESGLATSFLYGPGVDQPLAMNSGAGTSLFVIDGLGSITSVDDTAGATLGSYAYDVWGTIRFQAGTVTNRFGFAGRESAPGGLWFNRARFLDASLGRFTSEDPIRFNEGVNWYSYVRNSPASRIDPSGLVELPLIGWVDAGEDEGAEALDYWADVIADPNSNIFETAAGYIFGTAAALWTPCTSTSTFNALTIAYGPGKWAGRPLYKYVGPNSRFLDKPWLTRGWGWRPPYGYDMLRARDALQLPQIPMTVVRANVPWYRPVIGPIPSVGFPLFGTGGGPQYFVIEHLRDFKVLGAHLKVISQSIP